jgi:hypothetical protein
MATKRDEQAADYRAEAIASPFAEAAERSSTVSKTGEGQSGLRTERVTLEVTHDLDGLSDWIVKVVNESLGLMESVRVVEEACPDAWAQTFARLEAERDAAIRERDAHKEEYYKLRAAKITQALTADRFASAVMEADTLQARVAELEAAAKLAPDANADGEANHAAQAASGGGESVGRKLAERLGRFADRLESGELNMPSGLPTAASGGGEQPRGWLTEEEREAVERARREAEFDAGLCSEEENAALGARDSTVLAALLSRSTPPEVVLPLADLGDRLLRDGVIDALAAAGVAVKEVPRG